MSVTSNLKPCKEEHSIKEVTVSIFLSEPLDAFSSFIEIGEKYFSQTFQRFEKAIKSELKILANNDSQGFLIKIVLVKFSPLEIVLDL